MAFMESPQNLRPRMDKTTQRQNQRKKLLLLSNLSFRHPQFRPGGSERHGSHTQGKSRHGASKGLDSPRPSFLPSAGPSLKTKTEMEKTKKKLNQALSSTVMWRGFCCPGKGSICSPEGPRAELRLLPTRSGTCHGQTDLRVSGKRLQPHRCWGRTAMLTEGLRPGPVLGPRPAPSPGSRAPSGTWVPPRPSSAGSDQPPWALRARKSDALFLASFFLSEIFI